MLYTPNSNREKRSTAIGECSRCNCSWRGELEWSTRARLAFAQDATKLSRYSTSVPASSNALSRLEVTNTIKLGHTQQIHPFETA